MQEASDRCDRIDPAWIEEVYGNLTFDILMYASMRYRVDRSLIEMRFEPATKREGGYCEHLELQIHPAEPRVIAHRGGTLDGSPLPPATPVRGNTAGPLELPEAGDRGAERRSSGHDLRARPGPAPRTAQRRPAQGGDPYADVRKPVAAGIPPAGYRRVPRRDADGPGAASATSSPRSFPRRS